MNTIEKIEKVRDMFLPHSQPYKLLSEALAELGEVPHNATEPDPVPKKGKR